MLNQQYNGGYSRVYSAVMGGGAAKSDKDFINKKKEKN